MRRLAFPLIVLAVTAVALYSTASGDSPGAGNDFYRVSVEDRTGRDGLGVFTIGTGPAHPEGDGREILFAEDAPGDAATSYIAVRSYTTGTDYVQTMSGPGSGNPVVRLEDFGAVEAVGSTGYRTTYEMPGAGTTPEALRVVSEISVSGRASPTLPSRSQLPSRTLETSRWNSASSISWTLLPGATMGRLCSLLALPRPRSARTVPPQRWLR